MTVCTWRLRKTLTQWENSNYPACKTCLQWIVLINKSCLQQFCNRYNIMSAGSSWDFRATGRDACRLGVPCLPGRPSGLLLWEGWQGDLPGLPQEGGQRHHCRGCVTPRGGLLRPCHLCHPWYCPGRLWDSESSCNGPQPPSWWCRCCAWYVPLHVPFLLLPCPLLPCLCWPPWLWSVPQSPSGWFACCAWQLTSHSPLLLLSSPLLLLLRWPIWVSPGSDPNHPLDGVNIVLDRYHHNYITIVIICLTANDSSW